MFNKQSLKRLWPNASDALIDAVLTSAPSLFQKYHINTPLRAAHFMAQISHESDGGRIKEENLNYTTAARIAQVWPSRFTVDSAAPYVRNAKALANKVYNGRMGNRPNTNDGWNYRGRGLLQLTGKESYERIGKLTTLDLVGHPELVADPTYALRIAACEFENLKCLAPADADDIRTVTKRVNGGYIGIDSRRMWLNKWKLALPELPGELPATTHDLEEIGNQQMPRQADDTPPAKKMIQSMEGWAAVAAAATGATTAAGNLTTSMKPLFASPYIVAAIGILTVAIAAFIWYRRWLRLQEGN